MTIPEKKPCRTCGIAKPIAEFHKNQGMKDGHINQCRACVSLKNKSDYQKNADRIKAKTAAWRMENKVRAYTVTAEWKASNQRRCAELNQRSDERYPEKKAARLRLQKAVRTGEVEKPDVCEGCSEILPARLIHGHHEDYSEPLNVEWLCASCHSAVHHPEPKFS